ncbi:MAG: type II secretion system F family protein [Victivallales bacterium]|nr:type II secretion system F family protein [Victivallales bacterium]MCF7888505.1 type II secretion system F family protein [Victivallales bacterium]
MPTFKYIAVNSSGKEKKGQLEAADESTATSILKNKGLFPTNLQAVSAAKAGKQGGKKAKGTAGKKKKDLSTITIGTPKIPTSELVIITRQLAILLDAGLPLIRALRTIETQAKNKVTKKIISEAADEVEGGSTFSEALAKKRKSFNNLYVNMVKAGESAGALEIILDRLASFMEKTARIIKKVKSAMVYPLVVITVATLVTSMLMIFIVPKFKKIFKELLSGMPLPKITQFVLNVSDALMNDWMWILGGIIGFIVFIKIFGKFKFGKHKLDYLLLHSPVFGTIVLKSTVSRFARTLGTLLSSGVPVLNALIIVRDTAGNEVIVRAVQKVHDAVKEGESVSAPLKETKVFPEMVISMIEVGEETGKMSELMEKIADTYDDEVDAAVDALTSIIEPIMIVGMAVVVGTIVVGMFMPLIKIMQTLGS